MSISTILGLLFFIFQLPLATPFGTYGLQCTKHNSSRERCMPSVSSPALFRKPLHRSQELPTPLNKSSLQAGVALPVQLGPLGALIMRYPYLSAFIICSIKASAADTVAQVSAISKNEKAKKIIFCCKRNIGFTLYGGFYMGIFQEFLYNGIFPFLFGHDTKILTAAKKVFFDMLIVSPFLALPLAYIIKSPLYKQTFKEGIDKYIDDVNNNSLLKHCWTIWFPVQFLTFTIVPTHLRIGFIAAISFFWMILFSTIAGKAEKKAT